MYFNTSATVGEPSHMLTTTQINVSCNGGSNGSIDLIVNGGTRRSPTVGMTLHHLRLKTLVPTIGTYTVTVTDANGCTETTTATSLNPMLLPSLLL